MSDYHEEIASGGHAYLNGSPSLSPERPEPRLEITRPGTPTHQQGLAAERRAIVKAEDDEVASYMPPMFNLGKAMLQRTWMDLHSLAYTLEKMPQNQRDLWRADLNELAWSLKHVEKRVRAIAES